MGFGAILHGLTRGF